VTASRLCFLFALFVGLTLAPGYVDDVDSRIVLRVAETVLDEGRLGLVDDPGKPGEYGERGADGRFQMKFGLANAALALPFVAAGRATAGVGGLSRERAGEAGASLASALWFALSATLVFRLTRRVADERTGLVAAATFALGTYALVYGKSAYLEMPLTVAVLGAFDAAAALRVRPDERRVAAALGVACVAVLWIKAAACVLLVGLLPILSGVDFRRATRGLVLAAGVGVVGLGGLLWANAVRFGDPLRTGYGGSARFDKPFWTGVVDLLASGRGGLFVYSPVLLLALPGSMLLARRDRALASGVWLSLAAALGLYASFFSPFGGDAWGPRYLVPNAALLAVPASIALAAWFASGGARRVAAAAALAFSAALQVPPALVSFHEAYTLRNELRAELSTSVDEAQASIDAVGAQRLAARILLAKTRGDAAYDRARLGLPAGRHEPTGVERGWNLWPERVARETPRRGRLAWIAWGVVAAGAVAMGALLVRRTTRPAA
jgi:hypothetical protein